MEPRSIFLIFLGILMATLFSCFLLRPGSRMLKKKSHHYIVPPSSEKNPNWIPVELEEYDKFVFIKHKDSEVEVEHITNATNSETGIEVRAY